MTFYTFWNYISVKEISQMCLFKKTFIEHKVAFQGGQNPGEEATRKQEGTMAPVDR